LKKFAFMIVGILLVLGLVLPGCAGGPTGPTDPRPAITIGICGPINAGAQGDNMLEGAEIAQTEINGTNFTTDGVLVGATLYKINLVQIATNEIVDPSGATGITKLNQKLSSVDYVLGGFRTEAVLAYMNTIMAAHKIFIVDGAASEIILHAVADDYNTYKYLFRGTPPNELFLSLNTNRMMGMILGETAAVSLNTSWEPRIAILAEDADWTLLSRTGAWLTLGPLGKGWLAGNSSAYSNCGYQGLFLVSTVAGTTEINNILTQMSNTAPSNHGLPQPNMILTIMSGPCGTAYANRVGVYLPNALTFGINVDAQRQGFGATTYANLMILQDAYAPGVDVTSLTAPFISAFETANGEPPIYTAATYDSVYALKNAIESAGSLADASLIPELESQSMQTTGATLAQYYPKWDGSTNGTNPYYGLPGYTQNSTYALNQTQVLNLYPWLASASFFNGTGVSAWSYSSDNWTMAPCTTHDLVYGPDYVVGQFSQWQDINGTETKVGIWPKAWFPAGQNFTTQAFVTYVLPAIASNVTLMYEISPELLSLWDQYGWWNFEYPGTGSVNLTPWWTWLTVTGAFNGTLY
jgi:branched-chain amino acid transport system substrate-binding protein